MWLLPLFTALTVACADRDATPSAIASGRLADTRPDELPSMRNDAVALRYPPGLYEHRVQGNVTLRIHIDSTGSVIPDSTMIVESSGYALLDSAAVTGSERVRFEPAKVKGRPVGMSILLPVYFRHPDAPPLPGDTILPYPPPNGK